MKEAPRRNLWGTDMSATVLSAFYDMDLLYKVTLAWVGAPAERWSCLNAALQQGVEECL